MKIYLNYYAKQQLDLKHCLLQNVKIDSLYKTNTHYN